MKLKKVSPKQKGLAKLPKNVRNKMGYMNKGGKISGGGSVSQKSLYQTRKNEKAFNDKKTSLEAQIAKVKGTPEAKPLVESYRAHMKTMARGGRVGDPKKLDTKLEKIKSRSEKKAKKAHDKAEKKGGKVVGTKRVTTAAEPRMLSSRRETVKVYEKEQKALDKGVRKQSEAIDKDYFRGKRKKKRKAKRAGANILQRSVAKAKRRGMSKGQKPRRTGGPLSRAVGRVAERVANKGTAGSKARKRSKRCGKDCQNKIRAGRAGFARN